MTLSEPAGDAPGDAAQEPPTTAHAGALAVQVPPSDKVPTAMSPETALLTALGAAAADALARAVLVAVLAAQSAAGIPTYRDMLPGAFATRR